MQTGNFKAFLNALLVINPANGVLLIGAGNGHGELVEWLIQNKVNAVTLVEPQDVAFKQLETNISRLVSLENQNWTLHKEVVAEQPGLIDFYYSSKSTENGLISPELLNDIWPNLALVQKETLSATSLDTLNVNAAQTLNWLMIDCLGALKAIGQAQNLANVDVAIIKVLFNTKDTNTYSDYASILALFNAQGFDEKYIQSGLHPDIGYVVFVRNYQEQFKELKQNLSVITLAQEQTLNQLKAEQAAWQDKQQAYDATNKQSAEAIQQQQTLIEQLQAQLKALTATHEQTLNQLKAEQAAWQDKQQASDATNKHNADVIKLLQHQSEEVQQMFDSKLTKMLDEQQKQIGLLKQNFNQEISKGLSNTAKQIESFIGVQNYLEQGQLPFSYHGWPISPDVALFLLGKIEDNNYDLIIEFGSGTSTALFAKALLKKSQRLTPQNQSNLIKSNTSSKELIEYFEPSSLDLPRRVITFEHNKIYYNQTLETLTKLGLEQVVDLVYAPLVDYQYSSDNYLYYSCMQKLEEVSRIFDGRVAKILVLVDGPPGATGPLARFPAMPVLLTQFSQHTIHLVLDDHARPDEKAVVSKWEQLFTERSIAFKSESIQCEKGLYFCQIN